MPYRMPFREKFKCKLRAVCKMKQKHPEYRFQTVIRCKRSLKYIKSFTGTLFVTEIINVVFAPGTEEISSGTGSDLI